MDTSIVAPNNNKVLMVKLRRETSRVSYSTDNRSIRRRNSPLVPVEGGMKNCGDFSS